MPNFLTAAKEHAAKAKAGSSYPFLNIGEGCYALCLLIGPIMRVPVKGRDKEQNEMQPIVIQGLTIPQNEKEPASIVTPEIFRLSLNATLTNQWKQIMADHKGDTFPLVQLNFVEGRGTWDSQSIMTIQGQMPMDEVQSLVESLGWQDPDVPL